MVAPVANVSSSGCAKTSRSERVTAAASVTTTAAEDVNHHPDIDIRYTKIICTLSTHDAGGITQNDLSLAATIESLAER